MSTTKETVKQIEEYPYADMSSRGIEDYIVEIFNVRMSVDTSDGYTPTAFYFPQYDKRGKLCGWKKKDLTLAKNDKFYITTIGKAGVETKLFGQVVAEKNDRARTKLIMVEGEEDTMISYQSFCEWADSTTKYKGMRPFLVGLSCGTANATEAVQHNIEFVSSFKEINLAFDNDYATDKEKRKGTIRGKECTENVASSLLRGGVNALDWTGYEQKDPNDVYLELGSEQLQKLLSFKFKPFSAEKVVTGRDIGFETFTRKREEGIYIPTMPELMEKIHGFRKREVVVVTAPSGVGKSTLTAEIAYHLAEANQRIGMIFLEEETDETLQRMGARFLEINYNHFKKEPQKFASMESLQAAYDWCIEADKFTFLDHFGKMPLNELMNKVNTYVHVNKVDYIILDHLTMLTTGASASEQYSATEDTMVELAAYVAANTNDVGIILVSHLNRNIAQDFRPPKGKENEPFWVPVRKEDLKGASGIEQLSWIIIGVEPEIMPDKSRGRIRLVVLKNRPWGYLGYADVLKMDDTTGLLMDASDQDEFYG